MFLWDLASGGSEAWRIGSAGVITPRRPSGSAACPSCASHTRSPTQPHHQHHCCASCRRFASLFSTAAVYSTVTPARCCAIPEHPLKRPIQPLNTPPNTTPEVPPGRKHVVVRYALISPRLLLAERADVLSGFKKGVNRATTQVMMKTGHVERTNDRDFETELRRYRTMETAANKLQKEAKGYLDSLRGWWTGRNDCGSSADGEIQL